MKFKNFEGKQYNVNYNKPPIKYNASGLCENPNNKENRRDTDKNDFFIIFTF